MTRDEADELLAAFGPNGARWVNRPPENGEYCILSACYSRAIGPLERCKTIRNELENAAGVERLQSWNDAPGRTFAEVVELIERCVR